MTLRGVSDLFNRQGMDLTISHVPTGFQLAFPAFLDLMSDAYTCDWDQEPVFGRMDSIPTFRSTRRTLSLAWHVPAESFDDALRNVAKVNKLISFLYPLYDKEKGVSNNSATGGATAINQSPLVRVSFGNLIQNAVDGRGLLGYLSGITFDPALEFGMFSRKSSGQQRDGGRRLQARARHEMMVEDHGAGGFYGGADGYITSPFAGGVTRRSSELPAQEYYPKTFRLNFELTVLHEHELGFKHVKNNLGQYQHLDRSVSFGNFPYGAPSVSSFQVVGKEQQDQSLIKARYTKLKDSDPGLPGNVTAVDLTQQIEDEGDAVLREKENNQSGRQDSSRDTYDQMIDDLW